MARGLQRAATHEFQRHRCPRGTEGNPLLRDLAPLASGPRPRAVCESVSRDLRVCSHRPIHNRKTHFLQSGLK